MNYVCGGNIDEIERYIYLWVDWKCFWYCHVCTTNKEYHFCSFWSDWWCIYKLNHDYLAHCVRCERLFSIENIYSLFSQSWECRTHAVRSYTHAMNESFEVWCSIHFQSTRSTHIWITYFIMPYSLCFAYLIVSKPENWIIDNDAIRQWPVYISKYIFEFAWAGSFACRLFNWNWHHSGLV